MADGDSGIEGELGNHSEDTNAAEVPKENGEGEHVEETYENHTETTTVTETQETVQSTTTEDEDHRPVVELFVKAAVDKMKNGSCPICHRYFMLFYLLREHGLIDLVVTTFMPETPPKEVTDFFNSKRYPLVYVHKGVSQSGISLVGPYDTTDEIEDLVKAFRSDIISNRTESVDESEAESRFDDLYKKFNAYLKDDKGDNPTPVIRILEKVNDHLRSEETRFMVANELRRADCHLLPWLQHIRVAGKAYKDFEIPTELTYLWRYLKNAYETDAFKESCPADREIITHYQDKLPYARGKLGKKAQLMAESRTFSVPPEIANGPGGD